MFAPRNDRLSQGMVRYPGSALPHMTFEELKRQHAAGEILISVNTIRFNRRNSPFHRAWENTLPGVLLFLDCAAYAYTYGWTLGLLGPFCGAILLIVLVRRWSMNRVRNRVLAFAFEDVQNWNTLWLEAGTVSLREGNHAAHPPYDSWRDMVLPD